MKVWVLTTAYNDYDQHGDYFIAVFEKKPDRAKLRSVLSIPDNAEGDSYCDHILAGGGRRDNEYVWHDLVEVECR